MSLASSERSDRPLARFAERLSFAILFTLTLFLAWTLRHDVLSVRWPTDLLGSDSFLVVARLQLGEGDYPVLGTLTQTYVSQLGLQGIILSALRLLMDWPLSETALIAAHAVALLTAIAFMPLALQVHRLWGLWGLLPLWAGLAFSPWLSEFAHSLYWVPFLLVLPFSLCAVFGWTLDVPGKAKLVFLAALAALVAVKCLCGYEYLTTFTLLACAGYVLACAAHGVRPGLRGFVLIFSAFVAGFVIAVALHALQLGLVMDMDGMSVILDRAATRTGAGVHSERYPILTDRLDAGPLKDWVMGILAEESWRSQLVFGAFSFWRYFGFDASRLPAGVSLSIGFFTLVALIPALKLGIAAGYRRSPSLIFRPENALDLCVTLGLLAALSWQILAWNHMSVHFHLNGIVFALGMVPMASVWISLKIRSLYTSISPRSRGALAGLAGLALCAIVSVAFIKVLVDQSRELGRSYDLERVGGSTAGTSFQGQVESATVSEDALGSELPRGMVPMAHALTVRGWAAGSNPGDLRVGVLVHGNTETVVAPSSPRPDIQPSPGGAPVYGFEATFPIPAGEAIDGDAVRIVVYREGEFDDVFVGASPHP